MQWLVHRLDAAAIGALIALYERAVGFYATLINVNAYHQPGVEAGKKAAAAVLDLQNRVVAHLADQAAPTRPEEIAQLRAGLLAAEAKKKAAGGPPDHP